MSGLRPFRDPASVAVVGASADPAKWGHWLARGALAGASRRAVHLVNARAEPVLGQPTARSLADLPAVPELVAFAVPGTGLLGAVDEALALGVRGLLAITADVPDAAGLAARVRAAGARLIGPNCLGVFDAESELCLAWGRFEPGALAIVSQSGQVGSELAALAAAAGIGVSRFVSVGDQADVAAHEVLADLVDHEATRVVAVYLESFGDGARFLAAVDALRAAGKPTLVLTVGSSRAAQDAARTHTGSLTTSLDVVDAACRTVGAVRVDTPASLVDAAQVVVRAGRPLLADSGQALARIRQSRGPRIAIVGDSGGQGALAADVATRAGLDVVRLPDGIQDALRADLPPHAAVANPIDLAGAGERDLTTYARLVDTLSGAPVDAVLMTGYFGSYARDTPSQEAEELAVAHAICSTGTPVVVHSMAEGSVTVQALRAGGVPTYLTIEAAVGALATAAKLVDPPGRAAAVQLEAGTTDGHGYLAARTLLGHAGVPFPQCRHVRGVDDVPAAVAQLRAPYVVKADWLAHKTEHGGVVVGLPDATAVSVALADMIGRLGPGTYVVEEFDGRPHVVELIVGAQRDPSFGPVVLVGAGGVLAELTRDTAVDLADLDRTAAHALLRRLECARLLDGWRGRPPVDVEALVDVVLAVATVIRARADVQSVELNPVRVAADGALAVDALVVTAGDERLTPAPRRSSAGGPGRPGSAAR